jgi:hypothetical protein
MSVQAPRPRATPATLRHCISFLARDVLEQKWFGPQRRQETPSGPRAGQSSAAWLLFCLCGGHSAYEERQVKGKGGGLNARQVDLSRSGKITGLGAGLHPFLCRWKTPRHYGRTRYMPCLSSQPSSRPCFFWSLFFPGRKGRPAKHRAVSVWRYVLDEGSASRRIVP